MKKTTLKLFPLILFLIGCSQENNVNTTNKQNIESNEISQDEKVENKTDEFAFEYKDTTIKQKVEYQVDFMQWSMNELDLTKYNNIERQGDSLIFHIKDSILYIVNEYYNEERHNYEAPRYRLVEFYDQVNVVELQVECYEYSYHVLVDMNSADTLNTIGKPIFSRDGKVVFTSNVDLETQFTENGFEVFRMNENGFELVKTNLLDTWGVAKAKWIDSRTLLVLKATIDDNYDLHFKQGVVRLNIAECR